MCPAYLTHQLGAGEGGGRGLGAESLSLSLSLSRPVLSQGLGEPLLLFNRHSSWSSMKRREK
jgi:hypothetical protein